MNNKAVDAALENTFEVKYPDHVTSKIQMPPVVPADAPEFVKEVTAEIMAGRGDGDSRQQDAASTASYMTGHDRVREAQHRGRDSRMAAGGVPPVRHVLAVLPARDHSHEGLRSRQARRTLRRRSRALTAKASSPARSSPCRSRRRTAPAAGCASRTAPARSATPTTRNRPAARRSIWPRRSRCAQRARQLGLLPLAARDRSVAVQARHGPGQPVHQGPVRVLAARARDAARRPTSSS